jgi:2-polyprenyl-6-methoxyphenol hydroxylase-like FAD-dependent oxidoreductase
MLAAQALSAHVEEVTVVEAHRYPAAPGPRPGVPQAFHSHVLVTAGVRALEALLPGVPAQLLALGAHRRGLPDGALVLTAQGWFRCHETGAFLLSCSRWLTDHVVRARVLREGRVAVREGTRVLGLLGDRTRVTGAILGRDDAVESVRADLVVDATGRRSRAGQWLEALGAPGVEQETVDPGQAYATRVYQAPAALAGIVPAVMLHPRPAGGRPGLGATLLPIEGGRWIVTLTGTRSCPPPTGPNGFAAAAGTLGSPLVAELIRVARPLGPVRPYRATANIRRHHERRPPVDGLLVLGDALAAVNPVYSHGMSVAALGALRMHRELSAHGADPAALPAIQASVAQEAESSWRMAIEQDRQVGPSSRALKQSSGRSMARALLTDPRLMTGFFHIQTLVSPPPAAAAVPSADDAPPLTTDEAVTQHPAFADWWFSRPDGRSCRPDRRVVGHG